MIILNSIEYISEKLNLAPVTKERLVDLKDPETADYIRAFIKENNLKWNPVTKCYDCEGNVIVSKNMVTDGKLKIRFGHVKGYFDCTNNKLTTLEGAPQKVDGDFYCYNNPNLVLPEEKPSCLKGEIIS